jgi:hypothetical protein
MSEMPPPTTTKVVFRKVAQNLYRLESSGTYYALFKRAGKQIRRSLKTDDRTLARRRLDEFHSKVARLNPAKGANKFTFAQLGKRWLDNHMCGLPNITTRLDMMKKRRR